MTAFDDAVAALVAKSGVTDAAVYRLDETSGATTLVDSSGTYSNNGTITGSPTFGGASYGTIGGTSVSGWSGANYATSPAGLLIGSQTFTLIGWFKTTATSNQMLMARDDGIAGDQQFQFRVGADHTVAATIFYSHTPYTVKTSGAAYNDGNWHMAVMTYGSLSLKVYVDDGTDSNTYVSPISSVDSGASNIYLGRTEGYGSSSYYAFGGSLDYLTVIDGYVATASDVTNLYAAATGTVNPTGTLDLGVGLTGTPRIGGTLDLGIGLTGTVKIPHETGTLDLGVGLVGTVGPVKGTLDLGIGLVGTVPAARTTGTLDLGVGLVGTASGGATVASPWTLDQSRRANLIITTLPGTAHVQNPPATIPANILRRPIDLRSYTMPAPVIDTEGHLDSTQTPTTIVEDQVGDVHVWIDGTDVTVVRNQLTIVERLTRAQPGGEGTCRVRFPWLTPADDIATDFPWMREDARIEVSIVKNGTRVTPYLFAGKLVSLNGDNTSKQPQITWSAEGDLMQAGHQLHQVPMLLPATDTGTLIAKELNSVTSRSWAAIAPVVTGIPSQNKGSWRDNKLGYVLDLLKVAWPSPTQQWTVAATDVPSRFEIRLKDVVNIHATIYWHAPGIDVSIRKSANDRVDRIYGHGTTPDGGTWIGMYYPNLRRGSSPAYPFTSAYSVITIGTTDADTSTGDGVTTWQQRMVELGYHLTLDGSYDSADATACKQLQVKAGILEDGVVGPQTWFETFNVGSNSGDFSGAIRLPLAARTEVTEYLRAAGGAVIGPNPAYDPKVKPRDIDVDYQTGVTKSQCIPWAQDTLTRSQSPGWIGTVTARTDPPEGSRFLFREGQNVSLPHWMGETPLLHIVDLEAILDVAPTSSPYVRWTVDEHARDAPSVAQIIARDRAAREDPLSRPGRVDKISQIDRNLTYPYDPESEAGWIERHAIYPGLWNVGLIAVSQVGRVAKISLKTQSPAAPFAFLLFGADVTANELAVHIGNPLTQDAPWETAAFWLTSKGFIEGWGTKGQACGYYPGSESRSSPVTGDFEEGGFEFVSEAGAMIWFAEFSPDATFLSGRIIPAAVQ